MFKALLFLLIINLTQQNCKKSSPFCLSCLDNQCVECIYSFQKDKNCQVPQTRIKNCMFYTPQGKCSFCESQFTLKNNECVPIQVINCKHSQKQGECLICQDNLKLSHDKQCTDTCKLENCKNCATDILGNEFCAVCENGFSLNKFLRCQKEPVSHCDKVLKDKCVRCKIGYRHDGLKCHKVDYKKILEEKENLKSKKQIKDTKKVDQMVLLKTSNNQQKNKTKKQSNKSQGDHSKNNNNQVTQLAKKVLQNKKQNLEKVQKQTMKPKNHNQTSSNKTKHPTQHQETKKHHQNNKVNSQHHTHHQKNEKQRKQDQQEKIIVKADKLLNESRVNLETKINSSKKGTSSIIIPKIFMLLLISYFANQIK